MQFNSPSVPDMPHLSVQNWLWQLNLKLNIWSSYDPDLKSLSLSVNINHPFKWKKYRLLFLDVWLIDSVLLFRLLNTTLQVSHSQSIKLMPKAFFSLLFLNYTNQKNSFGQLTSHIVEKEDSPHPPQLYTASQ